MDEAFSINMASNSISHIIETYGNDVHPPFYYVLLHFVMLFGNSEFMVRMPSAIFGILTIPLLYITGKKFFTFREGLISAFLLSISYYHIYYSQEARMYTLLTFSFLASFYCFYRACEHKNNLIFFIGYILFTLMSIYTHYFGFFILPITILYILTSKVLFKKITLDIKSLHRMLLSCIVITVSVIPLVLIFFNQINNKVGGEVAWGTSPANLFIKLLVRFSTLAPSTSLLFSLLFVLGALISLKNNKNQFILMGIWFALPIVVSYYLASIMPFETRYLIILLPAFLLFIARGITGTTEYLFPIRQEKRIKSTTGNVENNRNVFIILILLLFSLVSYGPLHEYYSDNLKPDWRDAASFLEHNTNDGDVVIPLPGSETGAMAYYYDNSSYGTYIEVIPGTIDALEDIIATNRTYTVWIVMSTDIQVVDPGGEVVRWLVNNANLEKTDPMILIFSA
ncbi:MAG: glycosyltransferase family 39 protein [ANME-2 cluster archaeon]|nr:glycosyltransferase family 39 protein [ANME-2 cluster archaeon]